MESPLRVSEVRPGCVGDVPDTGVALGCGEPVVEIERFSDCACDACDSVSQDLLDHLDSYLFVVVTRRFRLLRRRNQVVITVGDGGGRARNLPAPLKMKHVLADPTGWQEPFGPSWLD